MPFSNPRCIQLFLLIVGAAANAQDGTAPNNYYPDGYSGSTFTGKVVKTTADTITLTYEHGRKIDTFEGRVSTPCNLPSSKTSTSPMPLTSVQMGSVVTAFYESKTIKVAGQKEKQNKVIAISFVEVNGRQVREEHRAIFYCVPSPFHTYFRAFN